MKGEMVVWEGKADKDEMAPSFIPQDRIIKTGGRIMG
jgi:hypothetical protein